MEGRKWEDLPADCLAMVFEKAGLQHLLFDIPVVCKSWHTASLHPDSWKNLDFVSADDYRIRFGNYTKLIQHAVTRSRGTVTGITLSDRCTREGLQYIANECPSLKFLYINGDPWKATDGGKECLPKLISKFKELEFLGIIIFVDRKDLKDLLFEIVSTQY